MTCPCKDCDHRHEACWGECEVYKAYRKHYQDMRKDRLRTQEARAFLSDSFVKQDRKRMKK